MEGKFSYIRQWQEESVIALTVPKTDCQIAARQGKHIFTQPSQLNQAGFTAYFHLNKSNVLPRIVEKF